MEFTAKIKQSSHGAQFSFYIVVVLGQTKRKRKDDDEK